ncbi:hypothetical protein [Streptomyces sp. CC77]|uniref:hypothetical protein n=1 Tax=Streptomyces sp. CC77 TaxID=1906739 RepID=UPI0008DD96F8|nr:hypothetical protein [Streptomyces sp. CC77]OII59839.1 hypothetical protein BJP39_11440 [Streptomyces sp. CC77]
MPVAAGTVAAGLLGDVVSERRRRAAAAAHPPPPPLAPLPRGPRPGLDSEGRTGDTLVRARRRDGRAVVAFAGREFALEGGVRLRHSGYWRRRTLVVEEDGEPLFALRYRIPWLVAVAAADVTYDVLPAEDDDTGLWLTRALDGVSAWVEPSAEEVSGPRTG